ncbi:MAG: glucose/arabinose dehydrogenase/cytochrome c5 [Cyclobacteriaceae bacterium]|jgi:glucose/arabinose dehydrogenase/cytochrome c5
MNFLKLAFLCFFLSIAIIQCNQPKSDAPMDADVVEVVEVLDSATLEAMENYKTLCSGCHGEQMMAFADRKWKHGKERDSLYKSIKEGYAEAGMPSWGGAMSDSEINNLVDYILKGIENVARYGFQEETLESDTFETEMVKFNLDTIADGLTVPWGMTFLPSGDVLITDRSGELYRVGEDGQKIAVSGTPNVRYKGQGGLLDVELHPDFENNKWLYLSYSDIKVEGKDTISGTAVSRYKFENDQLTEGKKLLEALPYSTKGQHFGSRLEFDKEGFLYVSAGDRGNRDENPQSLESHCGKIHRINDDGSIPQDNPFVNQAGAVASIYSYGHRNPQGVAMQPSTGTIWAHEHGPRGGDEVNKIAKGLNYGWPVISYGLNYNGTTFTNTLDSVGMEQPELYWTPSIAPSGMTFVNTDKYPGWEGDLLVGSLRFKYLNRCKIDGDKIVGEEIMMKNIGRVRNVEVGPDGYIYVAVEKPGYVFRLMPI